MIILGFNNLRTSLLIGQFRFGMVIFHTQKSKVILEEGSGWHFFNPNPNLLYFYVGRTKRMNERRRKEEQKSWRLVPILNPGPLTSQPRACRYKPLRIGDGITAIPWVHKTLYCDVINSCLMSSCIGAD